MSSFPNFSNISDYVQTTLNSRKKDQLSISGLTAWVRVASGVGNGCVLLSNPNFSIFKAAGDKTLPSIYGNSANSGVIGVTWDGAAIYASGEAQPLKPKPNITSIEIDEGSGNISRKASFSIKVYTEAQLNEGEYTTNWDFKPHQIKQIEDLIDDAEFDVEREEDTTKTTITSKKYADKNIEHAVKQATGQLKSSIKPGIGDAIQNKLEESAEDRLAEQISQYIKEITGAYGGDAMSAEDGSSYINETKLFADFGMESESDDSIESRFARSMSEVAREYDYMDNIDIPGFFDEYEDGDTFYAGPAEALKFFQTLPDEFVVTNNMNNVDESFKITKTGSDTFTAEEI